MAEYDYRGIGEVIRLARTRRNWSQQSLALAAGVALRTVQKYENGEVKNPSVEGYVRVLDLLNMDLTKARRRAAQLEEIFRDEAGN